MWETPAEWARGLPCDTLGQQGATEFVIDVQMTNLTSLHGIVKAGFLPVAYASYRTFLEYWHQDRGHVELKSGERTIW